MESSGLQVKAIWTQVEGGCGRERESDHWGESLLSTRDWQQADLCACDELNDVWFTEMVGSRIGRIRQGRITEINLPTPNSRPISIDSAPNGSV
jgi:hypothetical protein